MGVHTLVIFTLTLSRASHSQSCCLISARTGPADGADPGIKRGFWWPPAQEQGRVGAGAVAAAEVEEENKAQVSRECVGFRVD